jgi:hypothetical protein
MHLMRSLLLLYQLRSMHIHTAADTQRNYRLSPSQAAFALVKCVVGVTETSSAIGYMQ